MDYKDYEERIDSKSGTYIVCGSTDFETILEKKPLELLNLKIEVGEMTVLFGWFDKPVKYVGFLGNKAIFYLGSGESNLFEKGAEYYDVTYVFSPTVIGKCYSPGTFRTFNLVMGRWR